MARPISCKKILGTGDKRHLYKSWLAEKFYAMKGSIKEGTGKECFKEVFLGATLSNPTSATVNNFEIVNWSVKTLPEAPEAYATRIASKKLEDDFEE